MNRACLGRAVNNSPRSVIRICIRENLVKVSHVAWKENGPFYGRHNDKGLKPDGLSIAYSTVVAANLFYFRLCIIKVNRSYKNDVYPSKYKIWI